MVNWRFHPWVVHSSSGGACWGLIVAPFISRAVFVHGFIPSRTGTCAKSFIIVPGKVQRMIVIRCFFIQFIRHIHEASGTGCHTALLLCASVTSQDGVIDIHFVLVVSDLVLLRKSLLSFLVLLSIFMQHILSDLHQVIKSLFIQFISERSYNLLSDFTIDCNPQTKFKYRQQAFNVYKGCLINRSDRSLINITFHNSKLSF